MKLPKLSPPDPSKPQTTFDKIISMTPIALTVIATVLAGLSSSSMNLGQYYRGLAAQDQSKTGDQWALFQAKKMRQAMLDNSVSMLTAQEGPTPFDAVAWRGQVEKLPDVSPQLKEVLADQGVFGPVVMMAAGKLPDVQMAEIGDANVKAAVAAIDAHQDEDQTKALVSHVSKPDIDTAFSAADKNAAAFDNAISPILAALDKLSGVMEKQVAIQRAKGAAGAADFQAAKDLYNALTQARLKYSSKRYGQEAKLNQQVADLFEVRVRQNSALSDRHRHRSKQFFWGMLMAQGAVMISTFSIAMRQKSLLWGVASAAGLLAITFGAYVYAFV